MDARDDSITKVVYQDLVQLTFLCGRGLSLPVLMGRFLKTMAPRIPAQGLWLRNEAAIIAAYGDGEPPPCSTAWNGLQAAELDAEHLAISVLPEVALVARIRPPAPASARDVLALSARLLALAWQAESVALPELRHDHYRTAKRAFQRAWLEAILDRNGGNISACAQASGLTRARLYQLVQAYGLSSRHPDPPAPM